MELSVSQKFDAVYNEAVKLLDEDSDGNVPDKEIKINELIQDLEKLTVTISRLSLFSSNETYEELSSDTLKFLLLPYLLASLWQIKKVVPNQVDKQENDNNSMISSRKNICEISQIYFQDFVQRCLEYKIISSEPPALKLVREFREQHRTSDGAGSGDIVPSKKDLIAKYFDSSDRRQMKVNNYKEKKELEQKIKALEQKKNAGEDLDEETVQELYLAVLRKAVHEANSQLETIIQELNLLYLHEGNENIQIGATNLTDTKTNNPYGLPFKTFILTKTDLQKNVFGMGYPSLPVMTVEELYEKRRDEGIWPSGPVSQIPDPNSQQQELSDEVKAEEDAEKDDEEYINRQRNMDEYKDTHRRGWGNRMNRS